MSSNEDESKHKLEIIKKAYLSEKQKTSILENENKMLKAKIISFQEGIDKKEQEIREFIKRNNELTSQLDRLKYENKDKNMTSQFIKKDNDKINEINEGMSGFITSFTKFFDSTTTNNQSFDQNSSYSQNMLLEKIKEQEEIISEQEFKINELTEKISQTDTEISLAYKGLQDVIQSQKEKINKLEIRIKEFSDEKSKNLSLINQNKLFEININHLEVEIKKQKSDNTNLQENIFKYQSCLADQELDIRNLKDEVYNLKKKYHDLKKAISENKIVVNMN
jgi:hypothetical protein